MGVPYKDGSLSTSSTCCGEEDTTSEQHTQHAEAHMQGTAAGTGQGPKWTVTICIWVKTRVGG